MNYTKDQMFLFDKLLHLLLDAGRRTSLSVVNNRIAQGDKSLRQIVRQALDELDSLGYIQLDYRESSRMIYLTAQGEAFIVQGGFTKSTMNNKPEKDSNFEMNEQWKIHKILEYMVTQAEQNKKECFGPSEIASGLDFPIHEREIEYLCVQLIEDDFVRDTRSKDGFMICTKNRTFHAYYGKHYLNKYQADKSQGDVNSDSLIGNKVFLIHGHNDTMKQTIARTMERLGLEVIILHELPNKGRTIIEKFTQHSDVVFAVAILSGDDRIYFENSTVPKYRARQNVIFEMGYFIGKLGRDRVVAIHDGTSELEMLSDYNGVLFLPYDDIGKWKLDLVKEMQAAGMHVDANKL